MGYKGPRNAGFSADYQAGLIRLKHPDIQVRCIGGRLTANGEVQPHSYSDRYKVRWEYNAAMLHPRTIIVQPEMRLFRGKKKVPHTYEANNLPCLYLPETGEWHKGKIIANTIIPWTVLWLHYYEIWLTNGMWEGGGSHPEAHGTTAETEKAEGV